MADTKVEQTSGASGVEGFITKLTSSSDLVVALGVVMILIVMILPLPPFILDILLSLSISSSLMLLLLSIYTKRALDLSVFPSLLLLITLFRLSLSVASTRLVLLHGADQGVDAAGDVIRSFGSFVVGGNYAVGAVIFTILIIINFIVITKGAGRVAEVSARFTLDAMPGKQMAIDADLNAGIINEEEARRRRSEIAREADFFGAMDGSSKFVRGEAIAGILIVLVNIIGGILIGTLQHGKSIDEALQIYTLLTIGDGLVTQIPSLIVSTAAGILVTRSATGENLGQDFSNQLFKHPKTFAISAGMMFVLALIPGLPTVPFLLLAVTTGFAAYTMTENEKKRVIEEAKSKEVSANKPPSDKIENLLSMDVLELEVGYGLINLVDADQNGELLERITQIRKQFALDMGIIVPPLRIRDNLQLKPGEYVVYLKGINIGHGELMVDHYLAMDPGNVGERISGIPTQEPAFGLAAVWITPKQKERAQYLGYTVVDLSTVVATHLTEVVRKHCAELLGRQELQHLIDIVKTTNPKLVEEVVEKAMVPVQVILRVLQNLLKENVTIRDLKTILETLAENSQKTKDPVVLTEYVRAALGRSITKKLTNVDGEIPLITLDRNIEETIAQGIIQTDQGPQLSLDPGFVQPLIRELNSQSERMVMDNSQAVLLVSPVIRTHLKGLLDRFIPHLVVLSHNEISNHTPIKSFATVRLNHAS